MTWKWFELSLDGGASGTTAADVFASRAVEQVLAREAIQNSWDASQRYLETDPNHQSLVKFTHRSLIGAEKEAVIDALDLRALRDRVELDEHLKRDVADGRWIEALDSDVPLTVLYVSDYGPHGLYGHPRLTRHSPLWLAMRATAVTDKRDEPGQGSGGSFGLGKGAMLHASYAGILVGYSRFDEHADDPVTRRLEGCGSMARPRVRWARVERGRPDSGSGRTPIPSRTMKPMRSPDVSASRGEWIRSICRSTARITVERRS